MIGSIIGQCLGPMEHDRTCGEEGLHVRETEEGNSDFHNDDLCGQTHPSDLNKILRSIS